MSASSFQNAMGELQNLKAARRALAVLSENLNARISQSQENLVPASLHHGILDLPVEILQLIFKMSALKEEEERYNLAFKFKFLKGSVQALSRTCRRFRQAAISCAELWATINNWMVGGEIDFVRDRSKGTGLHVELHIHKSTGRSMDRLLHCVDDWRTLPLKKLSDERPFFRRYQAVCCRNVECLGVYIDWHRRSGNEGGARRLFFNGWSFPGLKHLLIRGHIGGIRTMAAFSHITEFTYIAGPRAEIRALLAALAVTSCLERLNIGIRATKRYAENAVFSDIALLPCLTSLHINGINDEDWETDGDLETLMECLGVPNITHVHLSIYLHEPEEDSVMPDNIVHCFLSRFAHLESVKHLSLELISVAWPKSLVAININEVLQLLPSLESLNLAVLGLDLYTVWQDVHWKEYPQLRSVNIRQVSCYRLPLWSAFGDALCSDDGDAQGGTHFFELSADSTVDKLKRLFPETIKLVVR